MGIKVAQFNVLLELQLITSLVISVESANTRVGKSHIWGGGAPLAPLKSAYVYTHNLYRFYPVLIVFSLAIKVLTA